MHTQKRRDPIDWKLAGGLLASAVISIATIAGLVWLAARLLHATRGVP